MFYTPYSKIDDFFARKGLLSPLEVASARSPVCDRVHPFPGIENHLPARAVKQGMPPYPYRAVCRLLFLES